MRVCGSGEVLCGVALGVIGGKRKMLDEGVPRGGLELGE